MESKMLRYFCAVAECGGFTPAAAKLSVAQPAISMAVKRLEDELGFHLFHRLERQISLTDEGRALYEQAKRVTQAMDDTHHAMSELRGLQKGLVRVGVTSMLGSYYIPPLLMAFRHKYPDIRLTIIDKGADQLQHMLKQGELDLALLVTEDIPDALASTLILNMPMIVAVATDHPFATMKTVSREAFLKEELAVFREGYFHRRIIDEMAKKAGIIPNIGLETNLIHLVKSFVRQGFGITSFLDIVVKDETGIVGIPFEESFDLNVRIAWRREGYLSLANRTFRDFIVSQIPQASASDTLHPMISRD